nr:MTAP family purine nucleoside phosphorylase [Motiliproteus sediminis]
MAIIGGTGVYAIEQMNDLEEIRIDTPYGPPSAPLVKGVLAGRELLFLARHGQHHQYLPHEVNYRANIWALKRAGATQVVGISAVGSLRQEIAPGDLSLPSQYFDFVKGAREKTFFGHGLAGHVSTAEPTCGCLGDAVAKAAASLDIAVHRDKTYGCVDGPRLGTRAESFFLRDAAGCDLVGMTNVPEVFLAREAQLCYCTLTIATDYDCWMDDPAQHVTVEQVIARYGASLEKARRVIVRLAEQGTLPNATCGCRKSLASAILTPPERLSSEQHSLLELLQR